MMTPKCSDMGSRLSLSLVLAFALGAAGCGGTSDSPRAAKAVNSMADLEAELKEGKAQVANTIKASDALAASAAGDPKPAYSKYVGAVEDLEAQAHLIREYAEAMRSRANEHYGTWQTEMEKVNDPELRARAQARREEALKSFQQINQKAQEAKQAYQPFVKALKEIEQYLFNDLTAAGIRSISDRFDKARTEGTTLERALDGVIVEIERVRREMGAVAPPK